MRVEKQGVVEVESVSEHVVLGVEGEEGVPEGNDGGVLDGVENKLGRGVEVRREVELDEGFGEEGVVLEALGECLLVDEFGCC